MAKANQRAPLPPPTANSAPPMLDDPAAEPVRSTAPPATESNTAAPPPEKADQPPVRDEANPAPASNAPVLTAGVDVTRDGLTAVINKPAVSQETPTPRRGDEGRPYCPTHQCFMQSTGTRGNVTHYGCPVPTCRATEKLVKPSVSMAREPWECPCQSCRKPQQYLEFDEKLSTPAIAHMVCPQCKFAMKTPRGQVADLMQLKRIRPAREKFGGR